MSGLASVVDLGEQHFAISEFTARRAVLESFDDLPPDPYAGLGRGILSGGRHRFRAYDDFRAEWDEDRWTISLLPHRPFLQSRSFNTAAGGIARELSPLRINPEPEVDSLLRGFGFSPDAPLHVKFHQIRVVTNDEIHGVAVVEGPHRDGHDWQIVGVCSRSNIPAEVAN